MEFDGTPLNMTTMLVVALASVAVLMLIRKKYDSNMPLLFYAVAVVFTHNGSRSEPAFAVHGAGVCANSAIRVHEHGVCEGGGILRDVGDGADHLRVPVGSVRGRDAAILAAD